MTGAEMVQGCNNTEARRLYMALELSNNNWKLMYSDGNKNRLKTVSARNLAKFQEELGKAKAHFKMGDDIEVFSCYEAGRDGFWIHRFLHSIGIENIVVDSSSIEVNRRHRRAKTDRVDVAKLLSMLMRYYGGEKRVWSVVRVPTMEQEDARRIDREIERLKKEKTAHSNRVKSLLVLHGIQMNIRKSFEKELEQVRLWDGTALPANLKNELLREHKRFEMILSQLKELEEAKAEMLAVDVKPARQVGALQRLKGVGPVSSWRLIYEFFGWRTFKNVKEVGAASGLAPTPYDSGNSQREQGISKAGNRRVRSVMIEVSWYWLRYQPQSKLSQWFVHRFGSGGKRMRRVGIVALARKLLVAFWKFLETGLVPEGAIIKNLV